jgi:hypothetical protein
MDAVRYEEFKQSIADGGMPGIANETFTPDQVQELEPLCAALSQKVMEYHMQISRQTEAQPVK